MTDDPRDPGWRAALRLLPRLLIPVPSLAGRAPRKTKPSPLVLLRVLYCSLAGSIILIFVVLISLDFRWAAHRAVAGIGTVVVLSALGLVVVVRLNGRVIGGDSPIGVLGAYREAFFLEVAAAEVPLLAAFVIVFLSGSIAPYVAGLICGIPSWYLVAPTPRDIQRRQEQLRYQGSAVDLLSALVESRPPDTNA